MREPSSCIRHLDLFHSFSTRCESRPFSTSCCIITATRPESIFLFFYDSWGGAGSMQPFHGKAIALNANDQHAPLPLLLLTYEYKVRGRNFLPTNARRGGERWVVAGVACPRWRGERERRWNFHFQSRRSNFWPYYSRGTFYALANIVHHCQARAVGCHHASCGWPRRGIANVSTYYAQLEGVEEGGHRLGRNGGREHEKNMSTISVSRRRLNERTCLELFDIGFETFQ